jgi:hypothetical protein
MLRIITGKAMSGRSSMLIKESSTADQDITYSGMVRVVRERRFSEALALTRPKAFIDDFDLFGLTHSLLSAIQDREIAGLETTVVIRKQSSLIILAKLADSIDIHSWFHCWHNDMIVYNQYSYALHEPIVLIDGLLARKEYAEVP